MIGRDEELERFKTDVPLTELAASLGYVRDPKASSRGSEVMRTAGSEKIVVTRNAADGKWLYFNPHDDGDNGSCIDFVQRRRGGTLGDVRKFLRAYMGTGRPVPDPATFRRDVRPLSFDRTALLSRFVAAEPLEGSHRYLTTVRGIPATVWASERFAGRVYVDRRGDVLFPHYMRSDDGKAELCGWEIKAEGITRFPAGGVKGLWGSRSFEADTRLAVAETALDALSHYAVKPSKGTRYVSLAGSMNKQQPELLAFAMNRLPAGGQVVLIFDNDEGGDRLVDKVAEIFDQLGRKDLTLIEDRPTRRDFDWNDVLRGRGPSTAPGCEPG